MINDALPLLQSRSITTPLPGPRIAKAVAAQCHGEGVLILLCGTFGNVARLLPPLVIGEDLLRDGLQVVAGAIQQQSVALRAVREPALIGS